MAVLRITSAGADLARLYPWLDAAADAAALPPSVLNGMHVALEEAVANVAMHAYPADAPGEIAIRLTRLPDGAAALTVEDRGPPFDPTAAPAHPPHPASIQDAEPGGLGLTLMRHYCSAIAYERVDGTNRLILRFAAPA